MLSAPRSSQGCSGGLALTSPNADFNHCPVAPCWPQQNGWPGSPGSTTVYPAIPDEMVFQSAEYLMAALGAIVAFVSMWFGARVP